MQGPRAVFEPTSSWRGAASVIFNLPGYRVVDAVDLPLGGRRVKVVPVNAGSEPLIFVPGSGSQP